MNNNHTPAWQKRVKTAQLVCWCLLLALAPLSLNLWGQRPFELPKVMIMRSLVWLLAGLMLLDYAVNGRSLRRDLLANPLLLPVGVLALAIGVTTATAVDPALALWGSYARSQGAVTQLTYLLLLVTAANQLRSPRRVRQLISIIAITAVPLLLVGLAQAAGLDPFGLVSDARSPLYTTLGRANFTGAYLALLLPLTLALALSAGRRRRMGWLLLLGGELALMGATLARSAWVAAAVSLLMFALLAWGPRLPRLWRRAGWAAAGLLALSGPLVILLPGPHQVGSTAARRHIWQGAAALIGKRPLLGYGADTLGLMFPQVYPPELVYVQGRSFFVDRAHNWLLEWAVTAGIPGLLAIGLLLFLFFRVTVQALRRVQRRQPRLLLVAILAAVGGGLTNNLVSFDVTPTATVTWLLIGAGAALATPPRRAAVPAISTPSRRRLIGAGLVIVLIFTANGQVNGRPLLADINARTAHQLAQQGRWQQAAAAGERAVSLWPSEPAAHLLLSDIYERHAAADPAVAAAQLHAADISLHTARRLRPGDVTVWLQSARFYTVAAQQFGADTRAAANQAFAQALALAPHNAAIYAAWGQTYLDANDAETAAPLLRRAVQLDSSSSAAYLSLAAAELALGRLAVALADYQEAVRLAPTSSRAHAGLADAYWQLNQPQKAWAAAAAALHHDPHNMQALAIREQINQLP